MAVDTHVSVARRQQDEQAVAEVVTVSQYPLGFMQTPNLTDIIKLGTSDVR